MEVPLPCPEVKEDVEVRLRSKPEDLTVRIPVKVSLGCHIDGVALPRPDLDHCDTALAGVCKRFATKVPVAERPILREFRTFVRGWIRKNLSPLPPDTDVSFETWLGKTNYPEWRKNELRAAWAALDDPFDKKAVQKLFLVSSFIKDEDYTDYKHARGINSRSDAFKCLVGPMFKLIEEQVYKHPAFIKHVPVAERPAYITRMLHMSGAKYLASDYTSFEALFVRELMEACEFELYQYMTMNLPDGDWFDQMCKVVLGGKNECRFKFFVVYLQAVRMSGEMCTSLGNGFTNLMAMEFVSRRCGSTEVAGVVEGDDGLFAINGPTPTAEDFAKLGLVIKLEVHEKLSTASFCGIVFDESDLVNIADPFKILAGFGWGNRQNRYVKSSRLRALLRCKALSLLAQYPGAPVLQELALYGLRVTNDIMTMKAFKVVNSRGALGDEWHRQQVLHALNNGVFTQHVPTRTRLLMEEKFGLRLEDQYKIEAYLASLQTLEPLKLDITMFPSSWRHYSDTYVCLDQGDRPSLGVKSGSWNVWSLFTPGRGGCWKPIQTAPQRRA